VQNGYPEPVSDSTSGYPAEGTADLTKNPPTAVSTGEVTATTTPSPTGKVQKTQLAATETTESETSKPAPTWIYPVIGALIGLGIMFVGGLILRKKGIIDLPF